MINEKLTFKKFGRPCITNKQEVLILRQKGLSITDISRKLKCNRSTIWRTLQNDISK